MRDSEELSIHRTREQILEARRKAKDEYGELFDAVSALLFRHDPIGINAEVNTDEYDLETESILPRLKNSHSAEDVQRIVHEEFVRWFDGGTAGRAERYSEISFEIWQLWRRHLRANECVAGQSKAVASHRTRKARRQTQPGSRLGWRFSQECYEPGRT